MSEDDLLHGLESQMADRQRAAWERSAELEAELNERLRKKAIEAGRVVFEFLPPEWYDADETSRAFDEFTAIDWRER